MSLWHIPLTHAWSISLALISHTTVSHSVTSLSPAASATCAQLPACSDPATH